MCCHDGVLAHEHEYHPYRTCYYENATARSLQGFPVRPCHGMLPFARARLKTFTRPTSFAPRIVCLTSRCSTRFSAFLCPLCVRAGRSYPCASLVLTVFNTDADAAAAAPAPGSWRISTCLVPSAAAPLRCRERPPHPQIRRGRRCQRKQRTRSVATVRGSLPCK